MKRISKAKERAMLFLSCLSLLAVYAPPVAAQGNIDASRAREAIERTDEVIASAKTVVDESRSQKAELSLQVAIGIQLQAKESYGMRGYGSAYKLTIQSREEAWHAIALARTDAQFEQNSIRIAEETREQISRLRDLMIEEGIRDDQALKLMEQSRNLLEKSRLNAQQLRFQLALKLAKNAGQLAVRAEEQIRNSRALKEMAERRLALLERLMERAREHAETRGDERVRHELRIAEEQLRHGHELLDAGRYREAKQALERCEKTLRNSVRNLPATPVGDPRVRLEEAHRLLERAEQLAADNPQGADPTTLGALEQAREMLDRAGNAIDAGRAEEGMRLIERSRGTLRSAIRTQEGDMTAEALMLQIERIEGLRAEARNFVAACPAPGIKELMERAEEHLRFARDRARGGDLESGAAEAAIARNLFRRISEICAR